MPIKKHGKKWVVDGMEFDSEPAAENAYKAKIALAFGIPAEEDKGKKSKKSTKKKSKKEDDEEDEEHSHED